MKIMAYDAGPEQESCTAGGAPAIRRTGAAGHSCPAPFAAWSLPAYDASIIVRGDLRASKESHMGDVAYTSTVRIERVRGPLRRAFLPAEPEPVLFGVHGAVAQHYGVNVTDLEPHATTLDYVVAAAGG
jgi:hypothetical protein